MKTNRRTVLKGAAIGAGASTVAGPLANLGQVTSAEAADTAVQRAPVTIPTLRAWKGGKGTFTLGSARVVVRNADSQVKQLATMFAGEVGAIIGAEPKVSVGAGSPAGAIIIQLSDLRRGAESYRIEVTGKNIVITGSTPHGAFNATRTLLQWLHQSATMPVGTATDWPDKPVRSLLADQTKWRGMDWWENLFRVMSYFKLNDTNLYVDGAGLTKAKAVALNELARKYFINLTPQLNMPGHMNGILPPHPEYQLVNKDGSKNIYALDLTNQKAVDWALDEMEQWIGLFEGPEWHMGCDEFPAWPGGGKDHPQLEEYARKKWGQDAGFPDLMADFQNQVHARVKKYGKTMRLWNDMIRHSKVVKVDPEVTVVYWIAHKELPGLKTAQEVADAGHDLVNAYADHLYYDQSQRNLDPEDIWNNFDPNVFPIENAVRQHDQVLGAQICVWIANIGTPQESDNEVLSNLVESMQVLAQILWGSRRPVEQYADFAPYARTVGLPELHPLSMNSIQGRPALATNADKTLAYAAVDAKGVLHAGHQSAPSTMHFHDRQIASGITGSPVALTGADGRVRIVAAASSTWLIATQKQPNSDQYATRRVGRTTGQTAPATAGDLLAWRDGQKLMVSSLGTPRPEFVVDGLAADPVVVQLHDRYHVVALTRNNQVVHVTGTPGSWQVRQGGRARGTLHLVGSGNDLAVLQSGTFGVQIAAATPDPSRWAWRQVSGEAVLGLTVATSPTGVGHLGFTTRRHAGRGPYGNLYHASSADGWTPRLVRGAVTDAPSLGFAGDGTVRLFAHSTRQTLFAGGIKDGKYVTADLVESQSAPVASLPQANGQATWLGATDYGDLQIGHHWGRDIWNWGRYFVLGTMAAPVDELQPDQFTDVLTKGWGGTTVLKPSRTEQAPAPKIAGGALSVTGTNFYTMVQARQHIGAGFATAEVKIDHLLQNVTKQNAVMIGFAKDEANYFTTWMSAIDGQIGFDIVKDGKMAPDGSNGGVPFVVRDGDSLAITWTIYRLHAYVKRDGIWQRVHSSDINITDDKTNSKFREAYRPVVAVRGEQGTIALSGFRAATMPADPVPPQVVTPKQG